MKPYASGRHGAVAVRRCAPVAVMFAAVAFVPLFAIVMAGASLAQDASEGAPSWEKLDSVLVLPPVYRPDAAANAESEPADGCTEDCSSTNDPGDDQSPTAVAGSADNPANASAGTADNPADNPTDAGAAADGSTPEAAGSPQQSAATGDDPQSADNLGGSVGSAQVGSAQDYEAQQAAAQEPGASGVVQAPSVIIGAPVGPYYGPRAFGSAATAFAPVRPLPASPAWMPQPMAEVAPLPSIVPYGFPPTVAAFPGGGLSGRFGGFHGGFSHVSGFHGGFGRR